MHAFALSAAERPVPGGACTQLGWLVLRRIDRILTVPSRGACALIPDCASDSTTVVAWSSITDASS